MPVPPDLEGGSSTLPVPLALPPGEDPAKLRNASSLVALAAKADSPVEDAMRPGTGGAPVVPICIFCYVND